MTFPPIVTPTREKYSPMTFRKESGKLKVEFLRNLPYHYTYFKRLHLITVITRVPNLYNSSVTNCEIGL